MDRSTGVKSWHFLAGAALAASCFALSGSADAATHHKKPIETAAPTKPGECKVTPDQASIGIRALQTELMVAGLKCSAEQWNSFTAKFKTTIKTDADRMQHLFAKAYGKGGASQMNTFVTQLANDASQRSNGFAEVDYCKQEDVLFQQVLALTGEELEKFSAHRNLSVPAPVSLCPPEVTAPATTTAAATPVGATTASATTIATTTPTSSPATPAKLR
jgi:hypothetical protein